MTGSTEGSTSIVISEIRSYVLRLSWKSSTVSQCARMEAHEDASHPCGGWVGSIHRQSGGCKRCRIPSELILRPKYSACTVAVISLNEARRCTFRRQCGPSNAMDTLSAEISEGLGVLTG